MGRRRFSQNHAELGPDTPFVIYALIDPVTYEPFYVGATSNLPSRFVAHVSDSIRNTPEPDEDGYVLRSASFDKEQRIRDILAAGSYPGVVVLEKTTKRDYAACERRWTQVLDNRGFKLVNSRITEPLPHEKAQAYGINIELMALAAAAAAVLQEVGFSRLAETILAKLGDSCAVLELGPLGACAHGADRIAERAMADYAAVQSAKRNTTEERLQKRREAVIAFMEQDEQERAEAV